MLVIRNAQMFLEKIAQSELSSWQTPHCSSFLPQNVDHWWDLQQQTGSLQLALSTGNLLVHRSAISNSHPTLSHSFPLKYVNSTNNGCYCDAFISVYVDVLKVPQSCSLLYYSLTWHSCLPFLLLFSSTPTPLSSCCC